MNTSNELLKELRIDRSEAPPSRRGPWIALGALALAAILAAGAWWLFGRDSGPELRTAVVTRVGGKGGGGGSVLDASGYVVARRMATVSAKITGKVREVNIEEGQVVKAGQVLATLDLIDADANLALARAQLAVAKSNVGNIKAQLIEGQRNVERNESLLNKHFVSQAVYDQAVAQRDALVAQLASAQDSASVAGEQLRIAGIGVDNTVVRAPFAGVVTAKSAQPGEIISPLSAGGGFTRTGICTIVDMSSLEIEVDVGEAFIGRVQPNMPVEATLNAYPDWKIPAYVIAIIPTGDRSKATVKVRIGFKALDPRILPDMGARVSFLEAAQPAQAAAPKSRLLVPAAAIVKRDGADTAFVLAGGKVAQRKVKPGVVLADDVEVTEGLAEGDVVVLDPPAGLKDGAAARRAPDKKPD
jgi:RND family efflux transporter MFP subunit